MRNAKKLVWLGTLAVVLGLGASAAASACTQACVQSGRCLRCKDVGTFTGNVCTNVGFCGCYEQPGVCVPPVIEGTVAALPELETPAATCQLEEAAAVAQ